MSKKPKKAAGKKPAAKADKSRAQRDRAKKAASASKGTKAVKATAPPADKVRKLPSANQLKDLMNEVNGRLKAAGQQTMKSREILAAAKRDMGVNPVAFNMVRRLEKIGERDPTELMVLLEDFDDYRKKRKLDDLAGPGLFAAREGAEDHESADGGESDGGQQEGETTLPANVESLEQRRTGTLN